MTTLTLHIGAHKTGTTAVQHYCDTHRAALEAQGVLYPQTNWYHHAQHRLAFPFKNMTDPARGDRPDFETELAELNGAIAATACDRVLVSSEEFFSWPAHAIAALRDGLRVDRVRILAVLRRPDDFLLSMYNQKAKTPGNSYAFPIARFVGEPETIDPDIDYRACVRRWIDGFGLEAVSLHCYEDGSPLDAVLGALGLAPAAPGTVLEQINRSVPGAVIEVMRRAKERRLPAETQKELFHAALGAFRDSAPLVLSAAERRAIVARMAPGYEELFGLFDRPNRYAPDMLDLEPPVVGRPPVSSRDIDAFIDRTLS